MIQRLDNAEARVARQIRDVFQVSYAVEAQLLGAEDFPPLKRPLSGFTNCDNLFFGFVDGERLLSVIELECTPGLTHLQSLVVHPDAFRRRIATTMVQFVLTQFGSDTVTVETGKDNGPARALYEKLGFEKVNEWDTDHGVRKVRYHRQP